MSPSKSRRRQSTINLHTNKLLTSILRASNNVTCYFHKITRCIMEEYLRKYCLKYSSFERHSINIMVIALLYD